MASVLINDPHSPASPGKSLFLLSPLLLLLTANLFVRSPLPDRDSMATSDVTPVPEDAAKMHAYIQDRRVIGYDPLVQPALLRHEITSSPAAQNTIAAARFAAARILAGHDDRMLVVVGPCSIHSPEQALAYAKLLKAKMASWPNLLIVMRSY
ncbi:hypothetical protein EIP91_007138, partial [Steccherinum ochraceum]